MKKKKKKKGIFHDTYRWKSSSSTCGCFHSTRTSKGGKWVASGKSTWVPCLSTLQLIAISSRWHRRIHPVKTVGFISRRMILGSIDVIGHLTIRIELTRWLPMQWLWLKPMSTGRTRRGLVIIHIVMMVMTIHFVSRWVRWNNGVCYPSPAVLFFFSPPVGHTTTETMPPARSARVDDFNSQYRNRRCGWGERGGGRSANDHGLGNGTSRFNFSSQPQSRWRLFVTLAVMSFNLMETLGVKLVEAG